LDRQFMDLAYVEGRGPVAQLYAAADEYLAFYLANPEYFRMLAFPAEPGSYAAGQELADRLADGAGSRSASVTRAIALRGEATEETHRPPARRGRPTWHRPGALYDKLARPKTAVRTRARPRRAVRLRRCVLRGAAGGMRR
jgi:hypothetical protein